MALTGDGEQMASEKGVGSEKTASSWEAISSNATGPEALRRDELPESMENCACVERDCPTCSRCFVGGSLPSEDSSLEDGVAVSDQDSWFEVDASCSQLKPVNDSDDSAWELVSCEVPVGPASGSRGFELPAIDQAA